MTDTFRRVRSRLASYSPLPLRLIVGWGFALHGYAKLMRGPEHFIDVLHALGVPAPAVMGWTTIAVELVGGCAVLVGAWVPLAAVPLAVTMVVAIVNVHWRYGFSAIKLQAVTAAGPQFGPPGYEVCVLYLACLAALVAGGPGPFAIDGFLARRRGRARAAMILAAAVLVPLAGPLAARSDAAPAPAPRFKAVAFDYFVLFDPNSIVPIVEAEFPGHGVAFTTAWRAKQFEYGFLRSITGRHADFMTVTGDALDYTAAAMHLALTSDARTRLLNGYLTLTPWPDTVASLERLRAAGVRVITIANFSGTMLRANADHAGITPLFDVLLSTEVNATYKPDARAYALGLSTLGLDKSQILFAAFGGWDAYGAKDFGYTTYWVNRFNLPVERLGATPDVTSNALPALVSFVLGGAD